MPVSKSQHRASTGAYQNNLNDNLIKKTKQNNEVSSNDLADTEEINDIGGHLVSAANSHEVLNRGAYQHTVPQPGLLLQMFMLLTQFRLPDGPFSAANDTPELSSEIGLSPSVPQNTAHTLNGDNGPCAMLNPVANALYKAGEFIARHDPLRFPAADASPMLASRLGNKEVDTSRTKRESVADKESRIAEHIEGHCAFEEEVLDPHGKNEGKVLIFQAQRAENPFRMIYDNDPDGRPSPEMVGLANGLNIVTDILSLGTKPVIGQLIASAKRHEYYHNQGDDICAERFKRLFVAELATSLDVGGLSFTPRGSAGKLKPSELLNALPESERADFYTRNPLPGIKKEILLELKQGKGAINDNGSQIHIKPTETPNEYVTYYPDSAVPGWLEKKVIVDENNLTWRYADDFDVSGLNVDIREGKRQIKLRGDYYDLQKNAAGKYEVVVNEDSGIKEYIPVYMEPLSRTWHLSKHNEHPVFNEDQVKLIEKIKENKEAGHYYIPRGNNNKDYYGNGNIISKEKIDDAGHYPVGEYIEMNGELVPVRTITKPGHGVHYEVYNPNKPYENGYAIEWDGERWIFEAPTSVHIPNNIAQFLKDGVRPESMEDSELSAPDVRGIRWNDDGTFIKINNRFYKIKLGKDGYFLYLYKGKDIGLKLSYGKNEFKSEALSKRDSGGNISEVKAPVHTDQRLNRKNAFKVRTSKKLDELLNKDIIRNDFKPGNLSPQDSMGIRKDLNENMYIKVKEGWVRVSKDSAGYYIQDGNRIVRTEHVRGQWQALNTAKGFPEHFSYYPGEHATATAYCTDGFSIDFDIDSKKTLTENLLVHFDAIDDGIVLDMSKRNSEKHNLFSINKISINKAGSEKSVYYPNEKPGGFKYYKVMFDNVPMDAVESERILVTPDSYTTFAKYSHQPYDLHVMKQGNMESCGYTCVAMVSKDLQYIKNIDESIINNYERLKDEATGGDFSSSLSESMTGSGIENTMIYTENPVKYIQDPIRGKRWTGIVNIEGHFCVLTKAENDQFYLRDPYQGTLSVQKLEKLNEYKIGKDIVVISL